MDLSDPTMIPIMDAVTDTSGKGHPDPKFFLVLFVVILIYWLLLKIFDKKK